MGHWPKNTYFYLYIKNAHIWGNCIDFAVFLGRSTIWSFTLIDCSPSLLIHHENNHEADFRLLHFLMLIFEETRSKLNFR